MSPKRTSHTSTTVDAGKDQGEEHVVDIVAGLSETTQSENEAGRNDSEYEWEKTAKGFKRRRTDAQGWTVSLFIFYVCRERKLIWYVFLSMACATTKETINLQGLRRLLDLRASAATVKVQRLRRQLDLRASAGAVEVQGLRRLLDL